MPIRIEFFGVPRHRVGVKSLDVDATTLGTALCTARCALPGLNEIILDDGTPRAGYLVNRNGREFISDPATPLDPGDAVLILSSDAGG